MEGGRCRMLLLNLPLFILLSLSLYRQIASSITIDTIYSNQSLSYGQSLTSANGRFVLGFFHPSNSSSNRFLGVWYNLRSPQQVVIWVANRESPLTDTTGVLKFDEVTSNLVLIDGTNNRTLWSSNITYTNSPTAAANTLAAKLKNYGNLDVLQNDETVMWSSFHHLTDTLVPGSEITVDLRNNRSNTLNSWRKSDDPSPGNFSLDSSEGKIPETFIYRNGSIPHRRFGPWFGNRLIGDPGMIYSYGYGYRQYYLDGMFRAGFNIKHLNDTSSVIKRLVLNYKGQLAQWSYNTTADRGDMFWRLDWHGQTHKCDLYNTCGKFAYCDPFRKPICNCMDGFVPRSNEDWMKGNFSGGCVRRKELRCAHNTTKVRSDMFLKMKRSKLPSDPLPREAYEEKECREWCSEKCWCLAYAFVESNCMYWDDDLVDVRVFEKGGEDLYIKLHPSELNSSSSSSSSRKKMVVIIFSVILVVLLLLCLIICTIHRRRRRASKGEDERLSKLDELSDVDGGLRFHQYDLKVIKVATDDFNANKKLGEGGFGSVYKGVLPGGDEIAVKRLSMRSAQGLKELKNEVVLISKLQHRNLVRLLGYCINQQEKLLIYEFMSNKSLDAFLFDELQENFLDWSKRLDIIQGIAQGILYLHQYSRLRIIHRDLKASNILLDAQLNPKISDFGTARIFDMDRTLETNTIVGTRGYMSPEYLILGQLSQKSDVYGFGILLLEILSSKRISTFFDEDTSLASNAWNLWKEGNAVEFLDVKLRNSWPHSNAMKCITVALLCIQEHAVDRPTMSSVVSMLADDHNGVLSEPKEPAFIGETDPSSSDPSARNKKSSSVCGITLTDLECR